MFITFFVSVNAYAMADRTPPVYGVPTLYGEYEISVDDARRVSELYGNAPAHPAAIRSGIIKNTPAAKHPVKAKKTAAKKKIPKKSVVSVAKKSVKVAKKTPKVDEVVVATPKTTEIIETVKDVDAVPVVPAAPVASQDAVDIAARVAHRVDVDSFCTQKKPQGRGNLPDGIIMMPGRPDLMSCVTINKD